MPLGGRSMAAPCAAPNTAPHAERGSGLRGAALAVALFAGLTIAALAPSPARAISRESCAEEFNAFVAAANDTFGEDYAKDMQTELLSTGPINMEFIDSF